MKLLDLARGKGSNHGYKRLNLFTYLSWFSQIRLEFFIRLFISLSFTHFLFSLSPYVSLYHSLFHFSIWCLSFSLFLSLSISFSLSFSLFPSLSLSFPLFPSLSLSFSLFFSISFFSLSLALSLSL